MRMKANLQEQKEKITQFALRGGAALLLIGGGAFATLNWPSQPSDPQSEILSRDGLHWHPQIEIYLKGEKQEIPANIGVGTQYASTPTYDSGMSMTAMHTHEPNGIIHFEFPGSVTKEDTKLENFFRIWGKDFMEFGSSVTMTVNGEQNTELENYHMQDGDNIELRYE